MNTGGDMEQQMAPVSACVFGTMLEGRKMIEPIMKKLLGLIAHIIEPEENSKEYRKNWATVNFGVRSLILISQIHKNLALFPKFLRVMITVRILK